MEKVFYPSHYCFLGFQPSIVVTLPHIWRVHIASHVYPLTPSYGSNWGHKIADFLVLPYIYFKTTVLTNYSVYYLPPGSSAGDYNLHHVCACVRACVHACVHAWVTQFSLKLLQLHIFGKLLVLMNFYDLQNFFCLVNFGLLFCE